MSLSFKSPLSKFLISSLFSSVLTSYGMRHDKEIVTEVEKVGKQEELVILSRHRFLPLPDQRLGGVWLNALREESYHGLEGIRSGYGYINYLSDEFKGAGFLAKYYVDEMDRKVTIKTVGADGYEQTLVADLPDQEQMPKLAQKLSYY